jgi:chromosome segregation ATPase
MLIGNLESEKRVLDAQKDEIENEISGLEDEIRDLEDDCHELDNQIYEVDRKIKKYEELKNPKFTKVDTSKIIPVTEVSSAEQEQRYLRDGYVRTTNLFGEDELVKFTSVWECEI